MRKLIRYIGLIIVAALIYFGIRTYNRIYAPVVSLESKEQVLYIKSNWNQDSVLAFLDRSGMIKRPGDLKWVMKKKNFQGSLVVPGKYTLRDGMSCVDLIDHLRAGRGEQEVKVTFNSVRTLEDLAGAASRELELDSLSLIQEFQNPEQIERLGFNSTTFKTMFLPDTYYMEWDTDEEEFIARMANEYKKFWDGERKRKADSWGLSQSEITILASIVQSEQQMHPDERKRIAGLYLNRLSRGMRLQSDPTVIYALGNFDKRRVLKADLEVDSPYNTYKYSGLPPGPINIPSKQSIDAVLYAEDHSYIFMCAKADFSGYHEFASSLGAHNSNARAFQRALNERKIYN